MIFETKYNKRSNNLLFDIPKINPQQDFEKLKKHFEEEKKEITSTDKKNIIYIIDHSLIDNKYNEIYNKNQISNLSILKEYKKIKKNLFLFYLEDNLKSNLYFLFLEFLFYIFHLHYF